MSRMTTVSRHTKETRIDLTLSLEGGPVTPETGIGFFDHMLRALAVHAGLGLQVSAAGDLQVDGHHTVEDVGIVFGQALNKALDDRKGITRFGQARVPMDEALADAALDLSGRPYLHWDVPATQARVGAYDVCLSEEFWRAVCQHAGLTLHVSAYGGNAHHVTEAVFKAAARALKTAVKIEGSEIPSTKGVL